MFAKTVPESEVRSEAIVGFADAAAGSAALTDAGSLAGAAVRAVLPFIWLALAPAGEFSAGLLLGGVPLSALPDLVGTGPLFTAVRVTPPSGPIPGIFVAAVSTPLLGRGLFDGRGRAPAAVGLAAGGVFSLEPGGRAVGLAFVPDGAGLEAAGGVKEVAAGPRVAGREEATVGAEPGVTIGKSVTAAAATGGAAAGEGIVPASKIAKICPFERYPVA